MKTAFELDWEKEFPKAKPSPKTATISCVCGRYFAKHGYKTIMRGTKEGCVAAAVREGYSVEFI